MAIKNIWEGRSGLLRIYSEPIYINEIINSILSLSGSPLFDDLSYIISDWSNVDVTILNAQDIHKISTFVNVISESNRCIKNAIVIPENQINIEMALIYKLASNKLSWDINLFKTLLDARSWVNDCE